MEIMRIYNIFMTIFVICLILILIINTVIFMDLKLPSKNISSSIRNKIKYLLRINITSINNIFKVFNDVLEVESIFPHDRPHNYVLLEDRKINAALKLATAPLQYIPDLEKDECKSFAYIQKLLILSGIRDKNIAYPGTVSYIKYSDVYFKSRGSDRRFDYAWADVELKDGTIIDGIVLPHKPMRDDSSWYSFYDKNRLRHMSCDEYMFNTMIIMLTFEAAMMTRYYGLLGDEKHNITRVLEEVSSICVLIKGLEDAMKRHKLRSFTDITSDKVLDKVFKSIGWAK